MHSDLRPLATWGRPSSFGTPSNRTWVSPFSERLVPSLAEVNDAAADAARRDLLLTTLSKTQEV